jgi:hypothetical protein
LAGINKGLEKLNIPATGIRTDSGGLSISLASTALSQLDEGRSIWWRTLMAAAGRPQACCTLMELQELSKTFAFDLHAASHPEVIRRTSRKCCRSELDGGFKY